MWWKIPEDSIKQKLSGIAQREGRKSIPERKNFMEVEDMLKRIWLGLKQITDWIPLSFTLNRPQNFCRHR
jgi:hypothetical protein